MNPWSICSKTLVAERIIPLEGACSTQVTHVVR